MSSQEGSHPVTRPAEADNEAAAYGALISRNVTAGKQRTSMRMEPVMWDALDEICWRERMSAGQIIKLIDDAMQIAALEALFFRRAAPGFETNAARVLHARAACEAVREYLVKNGVFYPVGRLRIWDCGLRIWIFGIWNHGMSNVGCRIYIIDC